MENLPYHIRKCKRAECSLRYPVIEGNQQSEVCPRCGGETDLIYEGMIEDEMNPAAAITKMFCVEAILDNIRSAWNVGSMFRTADGVGLHHLYLCGITPTPENPRVVKTALGAETVVPWSYHPDGVHLAKCLHNEGVNLWALEDGPDASQLTIGGALKSEKRIVLVVGNEISGVDPGIRELCEKILHIPMRGIKRSLNAAVAFGVAAHYLVSASA